MRSSLVTRKLRRNPLALAAALAVMSSSVSAIPVTWIGGNGSYWDLAASWSPGLPGLLDDAVLGAFDTTFRQGNVNIRSFAGSGQLQLSGGQLGISQASSIGTLFINGGTLTANASGPVTVAANALTWNSGNLGVYQANSQLQLNVAGAAALDGAGTKFILGGSVVTLGGASTWASGGSTIYLQGIGASSTVASRLVIGNGGTFDDKGNGASGRSIANYSYAGAAMDIAAGGSYVKSAGTGTTTVGVLFNNSGSTSVQAGILSLTAGGNSTGSFATSAGATLGFDSGTHNVSGAITNLGTLQNNGATTTLSGTYSGNGNINVGGGTLTIAANVAPANLNLGGGTFISNATVTAGTATFTGGTASGSGTYNVGALVLNNGSFGAYQQDTKTQFNVTGTATLDGANTKFIYGGATLALNGASTWNAGGGVIYLQGVGASSTQASKLVIGNGGTFDDKGNGASGRSIANYSYAGAAMDIAAGGSYVKSAGTGTTTVGVLFNNSGSTSVQAGILSLTAGGNSTGSFATSAGATLGFDSGTHNVSGAITNLGTLQNNGATTTLSGAYTGSGNINVGGGALTMAANVAPANLNLSGGTFISNATVTTGTATFTGGTASGSGTYNVGTLVLNNGSFGAYQQDTKTQFNVTGSATLDGANTKFIYGGATLALNGASTWNAGGGVIYLQGVGASSTQASKLVIGSGGTFDDKGNGANGRSIANYSYTGAAVANAGTYTKSAGTGTTTIGVLLNNTGSLVVQAGAVSMTGGGTSTGTFQSGALGIVSFDGGTHNLNGVTLTNDGALNVTGGVVNLSGSSTYGGAGTMTLSGGTLSVAGTLGPAAAIALTNSGIVTGSGTVNAGAFSWTNGTVGTYQQDTQFKLNVAGTAALDGAGTKFILGGATVNLNGGATWAAGGSTIYLQGVGASTTARSTLAIASGQTFDDKGNGASTRSISGYGYNGGQVNVAGTYLKSGGTGTTNVTGAFFNNAGTTSVQAGILSLQYGGTSTGTFTTAAGTTLGFDGGTHDLTGVTFANAGQVNVSAGTVNLIGSTSYGGSGTMSVFGSGTLNVKGTLGPAATLALANGGTISDVGTVNAGTLNWTGGQFGTYQQNTPTTVNVSGTAALDGTSTKYVAGGATLNLNGASTWASGGATLTLQGVGGSSTAASKITVGNGATFDDKGNGASSRSISYQGYQGGQFNVASGGTYQRSAGAGYTAVSGVAFNNAGTTDVQAGVLYLQFGGTSTGTFKTAASTTLYFDGGTHNLSAAGFVSDGLITASSGTVNLAGATGFSGAGFVGASGGTMNVVGTLGTVPAPASVQLTSGIISGAGTINGGKLNWTGGQFGTYQADTQLQATFSGVAALDGASTKYVAGGATLNLNGASTWASGGATLTLQGVGGSSTAASRVIVGSGATFDDKGNGASSRSISYQGYQGGQFNVASGGTYQRSAGTGYTNVSGVAFNNAGTTDVQAGGLYLQFGGSSTGAFKTAAATTLYFDGGTHNLTAAGFVSDGLITASSGIVNLTGANSFSGAGFVGASGGTMNVVGTLGTVPAPASVQFTSGIISGAGTINGGKLNWTGGQFGVYQADTPLQATFSGVAALDGASTKFVTGGATVNLNGSTTWASGGATLYVQGIGAASTAASKVVIGSGGTFDDKGNGNSSRSISIYSYTGAQFNVAAGGTYLRSAGTGYTAVSGVAFNNAGTTDVQAGALYLQGGGSSTGVFKTAAATTLYFDGGTHNLTASGFVSDGFITASSGIVNLAGATGFSGAGFVGASGGTMNVVGTLGTVLTPASVQLTSGIISGAGTLNGGRLNWTGGQFGTYQADTQLQATFSGVAALDGANTKFVTGGATVNLNGSTTWASGGATLYVQGIGAASTAASKVVVGSGGTFDDKGNGNSSRSILIYSYNGAQFNVASGGTYLKSAGTGTTSVSGVQFNNAGTVNVQAGALSLDGGGTSGGSFVNSLGASTLLGAGYVLGNGTTFSGAGELVISGNAVTASGTTSNNGAAVLALRSGGVLTGSATGVVNTDALNWANGTVGVYPQDTQVRLNVSGVANLDATNAKYVVGGATVTLNGASTWASGSSSINIQGVGSGSTVASKLVVGTGGTFDDKGNGGGNRSINSYGYSGGQFNVASGGTYLKSAGSGITSVSSTLFNNNGTVNTQAGVLQLDGGGTSSGSFLASAGAATNLGGGYVLGNGTSFSGAGELGVTSVVTASGTTSNSGAAMFAIRSNGQLGGSGTVNTDAFNWTGGNLGVYAADSQTRLNVAGTASLNASQPMYVLGGATLTLSGASTWQQGSSSINLQGIGASSTVASKLVVGSGGTFDDKGNGAGNRSINVYGYSGGQFNVASGGTYLKSAGSGITSVSSTLFNNNGTVNTQAGVLQLDGGGTSSGSFVASAGAATNLGGGYVLGNGTSFSGAGELGVTGIVTATGTTSNSGAAMFAIRSNGQLGGSGTVNTDAFNWTGGNLGVYAADSQTRLNVAGAASLNASQPMYVLGGATLTLSGNSTWQQGSSSISLQGIGAGSTVASRLVIGSSGTFTDAGNGAGGRSIGSYGYTGGSITVNGIWQKTGGTGQTTVSSTSFTNAGTVAVSAGRFALQGGLSNFSGSTLTGGTYIVTGPAATFSFAGANIATNAATIILDTAGSAILNDNTNGDALASFATNAGAGSFTIRNGRNFTTAGNFANAGVVNVGTSSAFATTGTFNNTGTLQMAGGSFNATTFSNSGTTSGFGTLLPAVQNSGLVRASGGTLAATKGVTGSSGNITIDAAATLDLGASTTGSTVQVLADAGSLNLGTQNLTVFKDYSNANFGSGNSFAARAGVTGGGQIIGNNAAMVITGQVAAAGANTYTLAMGNVRGGTTLTRNFQVANSGSGADIRGALQTGAPGLGNITDTRLAGSGVVAANFGPIAAGADSGNLAVTLAAGATGGALVGQSLGVVGNFGNLAAQTINITGFSTVLAQGAAAPAGPVDLGNFRVGIPPAATGSLGASNLTSGAGAERLGISSVSTSGNFAASNNLGAGFILPGASFADAVGVSTASGVVGLNNGSVAIQFSTNGQLYDAGFTTQAANLQTVNLAARGYLVAQPALPASSVGVGNFRLTTGASSSFAITNTNAAPAGFQELLNASAGTPGAGVTLSGSINGLAPGASSSNMVVGFAPGGAAGPRGGSAAVNLVSDGAGSSNLGLYTLASGTVNVAGTAYNVAVGAAAPSPLVLPNQRQGSTGGIALAVSNAAPAGIYSEALNASFAGTTGSVTTNGGSFVDLLAGGVNNTAMRVSLDASVVGTRSGSVTLAYQTDGSGANGNSGLAAVSAGTQTINVSGSVYRLAGASAANPPGPIAFANQRVGGALSQAIAFTNTAANDGFSERLNGSIAAAGTATAGGAFNLLAPGATSSALIVGVDTTSAGAKAGLATISLFSDGTGTSGLAPFALPQQTVAVSGSVYRLASASALNPPGPFVLPNQRVGGNLTQGLSITNTAAADGFSEALNVGVLAGGTATGGGGFIQLAPGATSNTLFVGVDTLGAGLKGGTVTFNLASDGTGSSGFAPLGFGQQTVDVSGKIYRLATANVIAPLVDLADQRVGGNASRPIAITNVSQADGFSESLFATIAPVVTNPATAVVGGNFVLLGAGNTSNALFIGVNTANAGAITAQATVSFASDGLGTSGLGAVANGAQLVTLKGKVFNAAVASNVAPNPVVLPAQRVGDNLTQTLTVGNIGPAGAFTERLEGSAVAVLAGGPVQAGGSFQFLAQNAVSNNDLFVGVDSTTAGRKTGDVRVDLVSSGRAGPNNVPPALNTLAPLALPSQTLTVTGDVYRLAQPLVDPAPIMLAARVGDLSPSRIVSVANDPAGTDIYTERLNASWVAPAPAGFRLNGSITGLGAGQASNVLNVALLTDTAGVFQGNAGLNRVSSGVGTTGAPDAALGQSQVALTGRVWAPAVPLVAPQIIDFGIARVGDMLAARPVAVSNNNVGALTDKLNASISSTNLPFSTNGNVVGLVSGQTNNTAITVQLATTNAGVFQSSAVVALASTNDDLPQSSLPSAPLTLKGTVNNLAKAELSKSAGAGAFSGSNTGIEAVYSLDFGTIVQGGGAATTVLALRNAVAAPADDLLGSWTITGLPAGFSLSGFDPFQIAAANTTSLLASLNDTDLGSFDYTVRAATFSVNGFGPDLSGGAVSLRLIGSVVAVPEPGTYALMLGGGLAMLAWARRRQRQDRRAQEALPLAA